MTRNDLDLYVNGARLYAAADKSDPFAFARAMAHIRSGIVGRSLQDGQHVMYNAEVVPETRTLPPGYQFSDGSNTYQVQSFRNVVRP